MSINIYITILLSVLSCASTAYYLAVDAGARAAKEFHYILLGLFYLLVAALLFAYDGWRSHLDYALTCNFVFMLTSIAIVDLFSQYIYDYMLIGYSSINVILVTLLRGLSLNSIGGIVTGLFFYGIIYAVARLYYKREAFGMGDVFLLAAIGVVLDAKSTLLVGFLAFYISLLHLLLHFVVKRGLKRKQPIAFGPSIAVAGLIVYYAVDKILTFF